MSLDRQDLAHTTKQQQSGRNTDFWTLTIDPTNAVIGDEYEYQGFSPCDSLWLPFIYDRTYGLNTIQQAWVTAYGQGPYIYFEPNSTTPFGQNATDYVYQSCSAAVYAFRFNSPANPWLLWGLGANGAIFYAVGGNNPGSSELMRSITGPISRLWWKLWWPASYVDSSANKVTGVVGNYDFSVIRLHASLGFSQFSQGVTCPSENMPSFLASGGYVSPQLNTKDRLQLILGGSLKESL